MKPPPITLRAARRAAARRGMAVIGDAWLVRDGLSHPSISREEWPPLPYARCCPGDGIVLVWYGDGSLPMVDSRAADRLISRHGPSALLRHVVPQWPAWVEVGLSWTNTAWPTEAENDPALQAERQAIGAAMQAWMTATGGHWICRMSDAARAAEEWARWWNVPRIREEALKKLLKLIEELPAEAARYFGRYDPKLTDEIAASVREIGGALHGGDGNSGECQHAAKTLSTRPDGQLPGSDSPEAPGGVSPDASDEARAAGRTACSVSGDAESEPTAKEPGEGDCGAKNPTAAAGESRPDRTDEAEPSQGAAVAETGTGDQPDRDGRVAPQSGAAPDGGISDAIGTEREGGDTDSDKSDAALAALDSAPECAQRSGSPKGNGDASTSVRSAPGGWHASQEAASRRALSLSGPAKEVARALRRLVRAEQVGLGDEASPRLSPRRLARELAGRSYRLGRAHREELEPGRIIIAPDLSFSCSACAPETLAAALAIAREMPDVVEVAPTSNGVRQDAQPWRWDGVRLLLVLGDWDGGDVYRQAAQAGVRIIWLDSFGKAGGPRRSMDAARGAFRHWRHTPVKYDGVGDAHTAAIALRDAVRCRR